MALLNINLLFFKVYNSPTTVTNYGTKPKFVLHRILHFLQLRKELEPRCQLTYILYSVTYKLRELSPLKASGKGSLLITSHLPPGYDLCLLTFLGVQAF